MKKKRIRRFTALLLSILFLLPTAGMFSSCMGGGSDVRIGVLREDDSSGEASAWEKYLRSLASDYGFEIDFTTTNSSASEVSAINTYASKGYRGILLFSDDDIVASVTAASAKKMYVVCPTGYLNDDIYDQIKNMEYFLGSVAPDLDTEYAAGYGMAKYFVEERGQTAFTVFGGATSYGAQMHIQRLSGMLAYLCEDPDTSYAGETAREKLVAKVAGNGLNPANFVSKKYRITGYMDGFAFDDAFSTKLTNSLEAGGTCILSVGAGDVITKTAYGIVSANSRIPSFLSGGVDAITADYAACFDLGYSYDCGKFASAMGPGIVMVLSALDGKKIVDENGMPPRIGMNYWVATSRESLEKMLESDNDKNGYCYDKTVLDQFIGKGYSELVRLCRADYAGAKAIHDSCHTEK